MFRLIPLILMSFVLSLSLLGNELRSHYLPRTLIFTQAQLKYSLNPQYTNFIYLSHWTDWPLLIDDSLYEKGAPKRGVQYPEFQRMQHVMQQYGLSGVAFWEEHHRRGWLSDIIGYTDRSAQPDFHLIPLLSGLFRIDKEIPRLLGTPHTFRVNGKMVILDPYSISTNKKSGAKFRAELKKQFGDQFLIISPATVPWDIRSRFYTNHKQICAADKARLAKIMADKLAVSGGFGWWDLCTMHYLHKGRKMFNIEFYRALMEYTGELFRKPEYKDKLFYAEGVVSHINPSRVGYILSSEGTQTLRESVLAAVENGVDIISIPEWDEENENTSLRPTVFNGTSQLRVMRYISGLLHKQLPAPLPGDNLSIPNLVFSMRKIVSLGERLNFELLNLPDRKTAVPFTVQLRLKDLKGNILHTFPTYSFADRDMQEYRPEVASETFADQRVLLPELTVTDSTGTRIYQEGLAAVQLQSTWNFDYLWVKQPLRDLMDHPQVDFSMTRASEQELRHIHASVKANETLSFAEVLDNYDCIYSASHPGEPVWRETEQDLVFQILLQSIVPQRYSGTIRLMGTVPQWKSGKSGISQTNAPADIWHRGDWVRMPRKDLEKAYFDINLPGHFIGRIPVAEIMKKRCVIQGGRKGFNLLIDRQLRQYYHPRNLRTAQVDFDTSVLPDLPVSVFQLQLISLQGKIWRSAPLLATQPSSTKLPVTVFSETLMKPVTVQVPENMIPMMDYDWDSGRGLVAYTDSGRTLWGIRGGFVDLSSKRNGGGDSSQDGIPCRYKPTQQYWKDQDNLAAGVVTLPDGGTALSFNGRGEFVAFPKGSIPRRSGFRMAFDLKPEDVEKKQYLLSNRNIYPGAFQHLLIEKGHLHGIYINHQHQTYKFKVPIPLQAKAWNTIDMVYDLQQFQFTVNGQKCAPLAAPGPGLFDIPVLIGSWDKESFCGQIRNLKIHHSAPEFREKNVSR